VKRGSSKIKKIPFYIPEITESDILEVTDVLRSGWITTGPKTAELESAVANYVGTARAVCLNSQTACAEMSLRYLEIGQGDEVIVPAYTYTATASAVFHVGAKIVFVDCQKDSLEMDYDALEKAITSDTKAIIPVDLAGIPCDYDRIFSVVKNKQHLFRPESAIQEILGRVAIVEDAAHALGASYKGKRIGSISDFTNFSFHAVKNLTTAEGGAMTFLPIKDIDCDEQYKNIKLLSSHGQSKDALSKTLQNSWEYDILGLWYKCNMTDVAAAMGISQFRRYHELLLKRKQIIETYDKILNPLGISTLCHYTKDRVSSGHLYITRVPNISEIERNEIINKMAEKGVSLNVHYKPLPMHTAYKNMGFSIKDFPNSYDNFKNSITLPLYTRLTDNDVTYVAENYADIVKKYLI